MYYCRPVARRAPSTLRIVQPARAANASFMPGPFFSRSPAAELNSLFRVLDDFTAPRAFNLDNVFAPAYAAQQRFPQQSFAITPKFDVQETAESYELRGEIPGVEGSDIAIEFTDPQTLSIRGQTTSETTSGTPPAPAAEKTQAVAADATTTETQPMETESHENDSDAASTYSTGSYQKPSVESADADAAESSADAQARMTPATSETATNNEVSAPAEQEVTKLEEPTSHYWLSERSQGSFQRTFKFPARVDQDAVKASLKNGILTVVVPKAAEPVAKRISVE